MKGNAFDYGSSYLVSLTMVAKGLEYGPAYHELKTNKKPKGGNCSVIPYDDELQELPVLTNGDYYLLCLSVFVNLKYLLAKLCTSFCVSAF